MASDNPAAPENNTHHTVAYRSEQEWYEDMFGKGPGDPDYLGYYPGSPDDPAVQEREEADVD